MGKGGSNSSNLQNCRLQEEAKEQKKKNLKSQSYWSLHGQIGSSHSALSFIVCSSLVVKFTYPPALFFLKADHKTVIVLISNDNLI